MSTRVPTTPRPAGRVHTGAVVHVDHSQDGLFRMNFNIPLPRQAR